MHAATPHLVPWQVMDICPVGNVILTTMPAVVWSTAVHVGQQHRVYQFLVSFAAHPCAHSSGGGARYTVA